MGNDRYDCIVIGAGPAGLSASLFLARYLRKTLTFHHNSPRNEYAHGVHGFLGHTTHISVSVRQTILWTMILQRGQELRHALAR